MDIEQLGVLISQLGKLDERGRMAVTYILTQADQPEAEPQQSASHCAEERRAIMRVFDIVTAAPCGCSEVGRRECLRCRIEDVLADCSTDLWDVVNEELPLKKEARPRFTVITPTGQMYLQLDETPAEPETEIIPEAPDEQPPSTQYKDRQYQPYSEETKALFDTHSELWHTYTPDMRQIVVERLAATEQRSVSAIKCQIGGRVAEMKKQVAAFLDTPGK